MPGEETPLFAIAQAVADGREIDWSAAESTARDGDEPRILQELKVIAGLAKAVRHLADTEIGTTPDPVSSTGPTWGPLLLRRELGQGQFGTVYLAWDPALEREVALKILRETGSRSAVLEEGRLLAQVDHPNVVTVYGVDEFDGAVGLWMELVHGQTVKQILAARGAMSAREAGLIGLDLCRALAAVHKAGLLHRDIKAQNVMREVGGRVVLMDFGAGERRGQSIRGMRGTPLYLAPEIFDDAPASIATDIYSLGVFLYHLMTVRFPVEGANLDDVREAQARSETVPLLDRRPDVSSAFASVVSRALERDPARRYRSAGAMQQDLLQAVAADLTDPPRPMAISTGSGRSTSLSLAVLPFVNLGPDQNLEYFCDGLAEELLTNLGRVNGLRVASRTSTVAAMQKPHVDIRQICRELDVNAVLEGSVRRAGDRLRISAQLVSAADGCHLWSDGYDRQMADVFAVQDEIARRVVDRLKIELSAPERDRLIRRYTDNPRAYEHYLKGRFYWARRYRGGLLSALGQFEKALEEDAGYALAHAGVADAYAFLGFYSLIPPRSTFARARSAAERALAIDPDLPEAHTSLALIRLGDDWHWAEAEHEFERAIALDPNQALARIYLSWLNVLMGDIDGGLAKAQAALELEPLSTLVMGGSAYTLFLSRRYDEAAATCERGLEVDPNFIVAIYVMGMCRAQQNRLDQAIALMDRAVQMSNRAPFYLGLLGNFLARHGETDKAMRILDELNAVANERYVPPHSQAYIYAGLGDLDRAVEWEARAFEDGASPFNYFSPVIENVHGDLRHQREVARMRHGERSSAIP